MKTSRKSFCIVVTTIIAYSLMIHVVEYIGDLKLQHYIEYCNNIYYLVLNEEFDTAKIEDDEIILEDAERNVIKKISYDEGKKYGLKYIENNQSTMKFWNSGFDDLSGLMYMKKDWDNTVIEGLNMIERCGGNVYYVSTQTRRY